MSFIIWLSDIFIPNNKFWMVIWWWFEWFFCPSTATFFAGQAQGEGGDICRGKAGESRPPVLSTRCGLGQTAPPSWLLVWKIGMYRLINTPYSNNNLEFLGKILGGSRYYGYIVQPQQWCYNLRLPKAGLADKRLINTEFQGCLEKSSPSARESLSLRFKNLKPADFQRVLFFLNYVLRILKCNAFYGTLNLLHRLFSV